MSTSKTTYLHMSPRQYFLYRQRKIAQCIKDGLSSQAIAERFGVQLFVVQRTAKALGLTLVNDTKMPFGTP